MPEDCGRAGVTENLGGAGEKVELAEDEWVEKAEGSKVHGVGRVMANQGGAGRIREPSESVRPKVSGDTHQCPALPILLLGQMIWWLLALAP